MPAPKKPPEVKADEFKSAKWNELTRGREFPPSAAPTLAILCQRHKVMRQAVAEMDEFGGGTVYENKAGDIKSLPQIATIKTASAEIRQLNRQLGIADGADERPRRAGVTTLAIIQGRRADKARAAGA